MLIQHQLMGIRSDLGFLNFDYISLGVNEIVYIYNYTLMSKLLASSAFLFLFISHLLPQSKRRETLTLPLVRIEYCYLDCWPFFWVFFFLYIRDCLSFASKLISLINLKRVRWDMIFMFFNFLCYNLNFKNRFPQLEKFYF